jgi:uncharacterized protein YndB with AHSA1/START domain
MSTNENTPTRFQLDFHLPTEAERVFAACTDADQLRTWFAEHVELEALQPGARFQFWGRGVLGSKDPDSEPTITAFEPGQRMAFRWVWAGVPTEVEWTFRSGEPPEWACQPGCDPASLPTWTVMNVRHLRERPLPYPRPALVVEDYWRLATSNLLGHLMGRGNVVLPDFEDPAPVVRLSVDIDAPPAEVFRALTTPEVLNRWLAKGASVDLREGGAFDLGWGPVADHVTPMHIRRLEQDRLLSISWPDWRQLPDVPDQTVTFELTPLEGGRRTRVDFTHSGFERTVDISDYQQGWTPFFDALAGALAAPEGAPSPDA